MSGATESLELRLCRHVLGTRTAAIPPAAFERAQVFLADSLTVGIAGAGHPLAGRLRAKVAGWGLDAGPVGEGRGAHVWGRPSGALLGPDPSSSALTGNIRRLPAGSAAFLNGFQIHCHEFDCVHEPAVVHPMATLLAALMAAAESRDSPVSGTEFLTTLVLTVDVAACLGMAARTPLKFFRPANAGIFAATLGVARLRGFDETAALSALGYALAFCAGTMQAHSEGKPALPVQIGQAARNAINACDMVEAGFAGAEASLTGPYGYFALFETAHETGIFDSLGEVWRITEVSHKPFPTGRAAQGGIPLLLKARAQGLDPEQIERVVVQAPPLIARLVGRRPYPEQAASHARLCLAYSGAVALSRGRVSLADFDPASLADPGLQALAARIHVEAVDNADPAAFVPQTASITLRDGSVIRLSTSTLYGSPGDPMQEADQLAKADSCCAYGFAADPALGAAVRDGLRAKLGDIDRIEDAGTLSRLAAGLMEQQGEGP